MNLFICSVFYKYLQYLCLSEDCFQLILETLAVDVRTNYSKHKHKNN